VLYEIADDLHAQTEKATEGGDELDEAGCCFPELMKKPEGKR
jgi:hypothetical protein